MMAAVFSMQGFGQFFAAIVALIITTCFRKSFSTALSLSTCQGDCQLAADRSWRIIIGFGMLPAIFALYYRITIPETPRFTFDVAQNVETGYADIRAYIGPDAVAKGGFLSQDRTASWSDFYAYFSTWRNGSVLFATMASWFLVDFAFCGLGLNNTTILAVVGYSSGSNVYKILFNAAVGNLILVCAGAIPGYLLSACMVDSLGRKPIQIGGFIILTLIFCIIGFGYNSPNKGALLVLYILAQLFFNFGPNSTTFIIPGECFPTRYRSTCHGLSAASGKLGATIAQVIAQPLLRKGAAAGCNGSACSPWLDHLMQIFALFMFCGIFVSFLVPETKGLSLEVLAGEPPHARYGGTADQRSRRGVLSSLGLDVHFGDKKESGKNRTQEKSSHGGGREDHSHMAHVVGDKDYSVHASNASSGGGTLRSHGQNEVSSNYV
jgi:PHS family inorganic phosphate transporter-like MFS transporter